MSDLPLGLSRRRFLTTAGITAGAVLLGACGGGDDKADASDDGGTSTTAKRKIVMANFFGGPLFAAGAPLRAAFGLADSEGLLTVADTPKEIEVTVHDPDGAQIGDPITIQRHAKGLERAYFPLELTLDEPGTYTVRSDIAGGKANEMAVAVNTASELRVIQPGAAMPPLETPTATDARGVNPICTRSPVCPLHDVTAAQALAAKQPLALLVATPAFCQVTICGPVLDVLLGATTSHPGVKFLHLEVYADPTSGDLNKFAPAVLELGLELEPCLFLVGSEGKVARRLDAIYDADELDSVLSELS
jgi:hypothetical protein